ncbi:hypothetical protein COOONC_20429 [Cooperia oncophora]
MPSREIVRAESPRSSRSPRQKFRSSPSSPSQKLENEHGPATRRSLRDRRLVLIIPPKRTQLKRRFVKTYPIPRRSIRKLAIDAGLVRLRRDVYEESLLYLEIFLNGIVHDIVQYCTHAKRKTIQVEDVKNALKRRGLRVYGFDD